MQFNDYNVTRKQMIKHTIDDLWKHPLICKIFCALGKHDYEFNGSIYNHTRVIGAKLQCFYCLKERESIRF